MDSTFTDELYHYMVGGHKEKYFDSANQAGYSGQFSNGFGSNFSNSGNNGLTMPIQQGKFSERNKF